MGDPGREKAGAGVAFGLILVLLVLCGGGYAAAYVHSTDKLPRNTTIAGVDVGGLRPSAAEARLRDSLAARGETTFGVIVDNLPAPVAPSAAGLGIDYAASVRQAVSGRSWHPQRLWDYYTGGDDLQPVTTLDESTFEDWVAAMDTRVGQPPREGAVYFDGTRITVTQPRDGMALDIDATRAALRAAYVTSLAGDQRNPVDLPTVTRSPSIGDRDVQTAIKTFANPAMSGPVTLGFGKAELRLTPEEYAGALSLVPRHGHLKPAVDAGALDDIVRRANSGTAAPMPATVRLVHGRPQVVADQPGQTYRASDVADAIRKVVKRRPGHRQVTVAAHTARADFRTKDARALKIAEKVASFTTYFSHADHHNTVIGGAVRLVDGTVLEPSETFSLNDTVGSYSAEAGSQLATTLFNAMFLAGLQDVEHTPNSVYLDRYPAGRDATVASGSVDLRFKDDTRYGVLISTHVTPSTPSSQGALTVSMWSTKTWDITSSTSDRYDLTHPERRVVHGPDCQPTEGSDGFDIDVTRDFHKPGVDKVDHSETFHTHYLPADTIVCKAVARG